MKNGFETFIQGIVIVAFIVGTGIMSRTEHFNRYVMVLFGVTPPSINSNLATTQHDKYLKEIKIGGEGENK